MIPKDFSIETIQIGDTASFERIFTEQDVQTFAELSGDTNPLHTDEAYAATTGFKHRLVHGMLVASLCSRLVGMYLPGKHCLYLGQTLSFLKPIFIGDTVTVLGTVTSKSLSTGIISVNISIQKAGKEAVAGVATVQII